ncbi:hypothetical protein [Clostridium sp. BNL1100]|uniref:hypothetical protein n=1 Tax=Clostridium sp. BNL1100 TaxID=755731 RepID=UPI00024A7F1F|nr:hypothetical protein [Clostridium sp. BNL1100]AEY65432.1 hypothetical protein Clo1100_1180 [Clostridium sp. BNL1100]
MKEKFAKLIDVKTIITFALVGATIAFTAAGKVNPDKLLSMATMSVSFFFAVKLNKV